MSDYHYLELLSLTIGWLYFFIWSFTFYPQAHLTWKLKSVAGYSIDFVLLNVSGHFFYFLYSLSGYLYPQLGTGIVDINDVLFSFHAFGFAAVQLTQAFIYDRGQQREFQPGFVITLVVLWTSVITAFLIEGYEGVPNIPVEVNTLRFAGYGKAVITI